MDKLLKHPLIDARFKSERIVASSRPIFEAFFKNEQDCKTRDEVLAMRKKLVMDFIEKEQSTTVGAVPPVPEDVKRLYDKSNLTIETFNVTSEPDGNTVKLCFMRPKSFATALPCVMYLHGGGMASGSAFDPTYQVLGRALANLGVAVALVDFRNSEVPSKSNPELSAFPGGLNDCYSCLKWIHANKGKLNVDDRIIVAGESGGGNLTISVALKCKQENRLDLIAHGFYSMCPYIAGYWPQNVQNNGILGTSHIENNNIILPMHDNYNVALGYGIEAFKAENPLAWPSFAKVEDLRGLPRCCVAVDEFDPLRDEGILFYRKLIAAQVEALGKVNLGCVHGSELMIAAAPDFVKSTLQSIADFASTPLKSSSKL